MTPPARQKVSRPSSSVQVSTLDTQHSRPPPLSASTLGASCFGGGEGSIGADGSIYVTCDNDFSSRLQAYSPAGEPKWIRSLGSTNGTHTPLIDATGTIYVANSGSVNALSAEGTIIWKLDGLFRNNVEPVIDAARNVYIIAETKSLFGTSLMVVNDGKVVENRGPLNGDYYGALLLTASGRVYYNSAGSLIYFQASGADASAPWNQMGGDAGRTESLK